MAWVGLSQPGPPGLLVNRRKASAFPSQPTLAVKSPRQERSKRKDLGAAGGRAEGGNGGKKNSVQLRSSLQRRAGALNLPLLPTTVREESEKKNQLQNIDY